MMPCSGINQDHCGILQYKDEIISVNMHKISTRIFTNSLITHKAAQFSTSLSPYCEPIWDSLPAHQVCDLEPRFGPCGIIKKFRVILCGYQYSFDTKPPVEAAACGFLRLDKCAHPPSSLSASLIRRSPGM